MSVLFAHHVEAHHVPVLLAIGAAGFWIGWNLVSRVIEHLARRAPE
jgi:hypothetical protein